MAMNMNMTDEHWHTCVVDDDYEINDIYPYDIRRIGSDKVISESVNHHGYVQCKLNQHTLMKHRIVALQFIPNDDPLHKTDVDHISHDRTDYHIENLRWTTRSQNNRNKTSSNNVTYEYVDTIPDDAIEVDQYGTHAFEFYYYSEEEDSFYYYTGHQYRKLHVNRRLTGSNYVYMLNTDNVKVKVYINKFKKLYDLM